MTITEAVTSHNPPDHHVLPQHRAKKTLSWLMGFFVGCVITILCIAAGAWLLTALGLDVHLRYGKTQINVDQPTVVRQIQQLQKLETVSYTMDKIIGGARDNAYLPKFLAGDRILLVVHGEVVAGVNLANIKSSDISVQGHNISLRLPAAEVFSTRIDNAKSRVYSRDTGLFSSPDPNLESEVREEAERQLQQAALVDGILKSADQHARNTVTGMLTGLGFTQVALQ
jgi:Protein of unknown function (DUF4230)